VQRASRPLRLGPLLRSSFGLLRARPVVTLALGAAVVLSLLSVCCGVGLLTTPWFMCELFALQLSEAGGRPVTRNLSWFPAGLVLLGAVLLVSSAAWLTLLGASPDLPVDVAHSASLSTLMRSGGFFAALGSTIALVFILPFLYAPLILIEERARFDRALLESARRVVSGGALSHAGFSLFAHALQLAPPALGALVTLFVEPSLVPIVTLVLAPLMCITLPLGQGMIVCAYTQSRPEPLPPHDPVADPAHALAALRARSATGRYTFGWLALVLLPLVSLLVLGLALVRPSRISAGAAPDGVLVAELHPKGERPTRAFVQDTALEVVVAPRSVRVVASDGGGAGQLPLRSRAAIQRVRIVRVRDAYAIEIMQKNSMFSTRIDRAGVRLDDDLRARLFDRVRPASLAFVLLVLLVTALCTLPVLDALARARRGHALPPDKRPTAALLVLDLERSLRKARHAGALLLPLGVASAYVALRGLGLL
jgi:hypothetical protein